MRRQLFFLFYRGSAKSCEFQANNSNPEPKFLKANSKLFVVTASAGIEYGLSA